MPKKRKHSKVPKKPVRAIASNAVLVLPELETIAQVPPPPTWQVKLTNYLASSRFATIFAAFSVMALLSTTIIWSVLGAQLHQLNADQLIDAYLFENPETFQEANLPGTHSFFMKWPLFALMNLYGNSPDVFTVATVLMVLATLAVLVYVLYRIEQRLIVFGLLCLALASVLLLIPTQPYPGELLPVNMAMTTTRNLEYALFVLAIFYAVQLKSLRDRRVWPVIVMAVIVMASDNLFGVLALGGAVLAAGWYKFVRREQTEAKIAIRWLAIGLAAVIVAKLLLLVLHSFNITNIINESTASPFDLITTGKQLLLGIAYGMAAIWTNFGANPVHAVIIIQEIPKELLASFKKLSIVAYITNSVVLYVGMYAALRLLVIKQADRWTRLSVVLVGSTLTAVGVFVATDHYYPVDARYVTISLFAVFIAAATYFRGVTIRYRQTAAIAGILVAVLPLGVITAWQEYQAGETALSGKSRITNRVSEELQRREIDRLIGDYWDVTPVKGATDRKLTIVPVENCTTPRQVLNSGAWFQQKPGTPAAYLAVKDAADTYGGCSLEKVVSTYGVPTERVAVGDDTQDTNTADVLLLLYAKGIQSDPENNGKASLPERKSEPIVPPRLQSLTPFSEYDSCSAGTTLQVVAHEDDDLLFMNPDLSRSVEQKRCIRTVYMTAGDAGAGKEYWASREQGSKAAYAEMYGVPNKWKDQRQVVAGHSVIVSSLDTVPTVSLIFMRIPDGNMQGQGFVDRENQSLFRLINGLQPEIQTVDEIGLYTKQDIIDMLHEIMVKDLPGQIRTQGSDNPGDGDHSDHHAAGTLTKLAAAAYLQPHTATRYLGYTMKEMPVNMSDDEITLKQSAFLAYAKYDGAVCQTAFECQNTHTYGSYLTRLYLQPQ